MGKEEKAEKAKGDDDEGETGAGKVRLVSPISNPLAGKKLAKKVLKTIKKAAAAKAIKRGFKEVVKAIKKQEKGLCIIAGDISPVDVIAHVPILCEEKELPYIYVPSKEELGLASLTKRATSIVLVPCGAGADYKEAFEEVKGEIQKAMPKFAN